MNPYYIIIFFLILGIVMVRVSNRIKRNKKYISIIQAAINQEIIEYENYMMFFYSYRIWGIVLISVSAISFPIFLFLSSVTGL